MGMWSVEKFPFLFQCLRSPAAPAAPSPRGTQLPRGAAPAAPNPSGTQTPQGGGQSPVPETAVGPTAHAVPCAHRWLAQDGGRDR